MSTRVAWKYMCIFYSVDIALACLHGVKMYIYCSSQKRTVMNPFCSVPSRQKYMCNTAIPYTINGKGMGWRTAMGKQRNMQLAIPIIAGTKKTPEDPRKPKEVLIYPSNRI